MKKLSIKLVLFVIFITTISSVLSFFIATILRNVLFADSDFITKMFFGVAVRELTYPLATVVVALVIAGSTSKAFINPLTALSKATQRIADGDFSVRIKEKKNKDEIGQLQRNFNRMARELEGNELLKKDFTANMSHQFNTPLSIIKGYSKLLEQDDISDEDRKKYAGLITRESERLALLSENILRLSKLEAQEFIASPKSFLLDEQILQSIVRLEQKWEKKGIEFSVDMPETYYTGDEELLAHVWFNIVDNAICYSDGGEIEVILKNENDSIVVSIADSGQGMDEETRKHAFTRYYSGSSAHKGGSGLGLSIAARIVELHKGTISVESELGKGTKVIVSLPVVQEDKSKAKKSK
ncbi:MAG: HAMP domain-containing histidine kinase [Clostridia bacterium]|nr:HAMP domain-containing histidine kinase [Clostridia bacterium]